MEILTLIVIALIAVGSIAYIATNLIYICAPNEALIFSGGQNSDGSARVGYRIIQGGRGIRVPLFEIVERIDLTNMIIDLKVAGAYSRGGIPLNLEGVANVKIASSQPIIGNAIERLLGKPRKELISIARETLEGNLRGVLATLTPEEVNQDRVKFAESLLHEADHDLRKLGLVLDTLKIQNVSDDKGYLDSLGRRQTAELLKRSRVAEAENKALAAERSAENLLKQEVAKVNAQISVARADAERRIIDARTKGSAMIAEQRATVMAQVARSHADVEVQKARLEQVRLRLIADQIKPAEAARQQMEENARGQAAKIVEQGKANASALRAISRTWRRAGDSARQIFVAQKLGGLVGHMMSTVGEITVDKVTFIDNELTRGGADLAVRAAVTSEQLKHTMGVDLPALLNRLGTMPPAAQSGAAKAVRGNGSQAQHVDARMAHKGPEQ